MRGLQSLTLLKVDGGKSNASLRVQHVNILILRMFITLTSSSCVGFGYFVNKTLSLYNFWIWNSNKTFLVHWDSIPIAHDKHIHL